jgi:hypothetical protein
MLRAPTAQSTNQDTGKLSALLTDDISTREPWEVHAASPCQAAANEQACT